MDTTSNNITLGIEWLNKNPGLGIFIAAIGLVIVVLGFLISGVKYLFKILTKTRELKNQYITIIDRYHIDWTTEDSVSRNTAGAINLLNRLKGDLSEFIPQIKNNKTMNNSLILEIAKLKELEKHHFSMDAGMSLRDFWEKGNTIFEALYRLSEKHMK